MAGSSLFRMKHYRHHSVRGESEIVCDTTLKLSKIYSTFTSMEDLQIPLVDPLRVNDLKIRLKALILKKNKGKNHGVDVSKGNKGL